MSLGTRNPINLFRSAKYRKKNFKKDVFPFYGFKIFFGEFGSGKTLSCVAEIIELCQKYPDSVLITNTAIKRY